MNYLADIAKRKQEHLFRARKIMYAKDHNQVNCDGNKVISFCSNDYLGLAVSEEIIDAIKLNLHQYGFGAGGAQLVSGYSSIHQKLEIDLANFFKQDRALLFSTGYMANLGVLTTLIVRYDIVLADQLCHASILDGIKFSRVSFRRFRHNDITHLRSLVTKCNTSRTGSRATIWIVTEGVFSVNGDISLLHEIATLKREYNNIRIIVDDSHGVGVLGENGRGVIEYWHVTNEIDLLISSFGKAFGGSGAFVVGSALLIEFLLQFSRPYIYTTALPHVAVAAMIVSMELISHGKSLREQLEKLIIYFRMQAKVCGLELVNPDVTPIQPLLFRDAAIARRIGEVLFARGFWVWAVVPPTVAPNTARLRFSLNVNHTRADIDALLQVLIEILQCI